MKGLALVTLLLYSQFGYAANCGSKAVAASKAKLAVTKCELVWVKYSMVKSAKEPTDTCATQLAAFIQSSKDLRVCRFPTPTPTPTPVTPTPVSK